MAAPIYFDRVSHDGHDCRDGGLKESDPSRVAVTEARGIWGDNKPCDIVLSVGSGYARSTPVVPGKPLRMHSGLYHMFMNLLDTMNGKEAWERFYDTLDQGQKERAGRLNVKFSQETEPAFDDVEAMARMEREAKAFVFPVEVSKSPTSPVVGPVQTTMIDIIADRLRASMFFFDLDRVTQTKGMSYIEGKIYCRLSAGQRAPDEGAAKESDLKCERAFKDLLARTKFFRIQSGINGHAAAEVEIPEVQRKGTVALRLPVTMQGQLLGAPVRIDVNFGQSHCVAISGFPMQLNVSFACIMPMYA